MGKFCFGAEEYRQWYTTAQGLLVRAEACTLPGPREEPVNHGPQGHVWGDLMTGPVPGVWWGRGTVLFLPHRTLSVRSAGSRKEEQSHGSSQPPEQDAVWSKQLCKSPLS